MEIPLTNTTADAESHDDGLKRDSFTSSALGQILSKHSVRRLQDACLHPARGFVLKIRIDKAACVGNARCAAVAPELFPLDDNGYIQVTEIDVPPGQEELARRGARACPERIIVVEDDE